MRAFAAALMTALALYSPHTPATADEIIQFKKGTVSATVHGQVSRYTKTYQFRARQGQKLTISLAPDGGDKGMLTVSVNAYCGEEYGRPLVDQALRWQGSLPCSDRYSVDVTPAVEARELMRAQNYALTITIQ